MVLRYLNDFADGLSKEMLGRWQAGTLKLTDEQEARGRILAIKEVAELPIEAVRAFYGIGAPKA